MDKSDDFVESFDSDPFNYQPLKRKRQVQSPTQKKKPGPASQKKVSGKNKENPPKCVKPRKVQTAATGRTRNGAKTKKSPQKPLTLKSRTQHRQPLSSQLDIATLKGKTIEILFVNKTFSYRGNPH